MDRVRLVFAWLIVGMWVGSLVLDAIVSTYKAPAGIQILAMLVAGALFGPTITTRNGREQ